ncbi:protein kinase superfamily protein [Actinidia rufa]|uniref:ethanolamine kinase n=1 Tax=Actinidia rufa TaxID=165716 RepID=A0A7J0DRM2_9ERIC|nr:protein kinase superfamily protein [Actinidia rufa]
MGAVKICTAMEDGSSEIPSSSLTVDHTLSLPEMTPRIIELCKDIFKKWSKLNNSHFSVETVSGGITNLLLKVSVREENGSVVDLTIRLYGPNTEYVINRERELQAIRYLSAAGFGAKLLGVFGNGMVQSFINARTLVPSDMSQPKLAAEIAKQLRRFHQVEIPGSKEPQLWKDILKFFQKASTLLFDDSEKQTKYETISFDEVYAEVVELKELTGRLNAPVVFAHNDLLSGNLMHNEEEGMADIYQRKYDIFAKIHQVAIVSLVVQFCSIGFDIGNHFNEYAGYDCDYSLYPSKDEQYHFFRHYLEPEKPLEAKMSPIDFEYLGYFFLRYNEYKKQKETCFSLAQSYLSRSETGQCSSL